MEKGGYIYIITNPSNTVLYVGVTSSIKQRIHQHKTKFRPTSFSARYNINKLVYYEQFEGIAEAMKREKQLKAGSRNTKTDLIQSFNPKWLDLFDTLEE
ncbi:MAG: GIY-YIG nuclease family protein [Bacteroidota bacterium]